MKKITYYYTSDKNHYFRPHDWQTPSCLPRGPYLRALCPASFSLCLPDIPHSLVLTALESINNADCCRAHPSANIHHLLLQSSYDAIA